MKKVYIAHPYTTHGDAASNFDRQVEICKMVFGAGFIPVSPILTFGQTIPHNDAYYKTAMEACFWLLKHCDEVWFFGEWEQSKGCLMEKEYAEKLGLPIVTNRGPAFPKRN